MKSNNYDLIIVGAGPAGLTASLYTARYKINHLVIGDPFSSLICDAHLLENYPGFEKISGLEFMERLIKQVKNYKVEILNEKVIEIISNFQFPISKQIPNSKFQNFEVKTSSGETFKTKSLIIATGTERKRLSIPGEKEFLGKGVSYCATCDAPLFKGKNVAVIGGSSAALMAADLLSSYAKEVYLIYRKNQFRAEPIWQERIKKNKKVIPIFERNIIEIKGKEKVERVILDNEYQGEKSLKIDGVIIEIGQEPVSKLVKEIGVELDENGLIKIKEDGSTNIAGLFAAGDITTGSYRFRQVITACAEGAVAALGVYNYLKTRY